MIDKVKAFILVRALYGFKSSGGAFIEFLAERLYDMGFKSSVADPGVWCREAKKNDCEEYDECILVYMDYLLAISLYSISIILEVAEKYKLRKDNIEPRKLFLGWSLSKKSLNGQEIWTMSSVDYAKAILKNIEVRLTKEVMKLPAQAETPMSSDYKPKLDATAELEPYGITMYQDLIGELRWAIEIGRVNILHEVSVLSSYQAAPRDGHS